MEPLPLREVALYVQTLAPFQLQGKRRWLLCCLAMTLSRAKEGFVCQGPGCSEQAGFQYWKNGMVQELPRKYCTFGFS